MDNIYTRSLIKDYRFKIYHKFIKAIKEYNLLSEGDKVMVCISGGKDSFVMALCFMELLKWSDFPFTVRYVVMDPGYTQEKLEEIKYNASLLNIPIEIFQTKIFEISAQNEDKRCYICAKMRRGALYNHAKEIGCNKIALGQHFNDAIETTLMSIFYSGKVETMLPKVKSENYEGLSLIRPLYLVEEDDIISFEKSNNLSFLKCGCFLTENKILCEQSKRQYIKKLIKELKLNTDTVDKNIFKSMENVNIEKVLAYKEKGKKHSNI